MDMTTVHVANSEVEAEVVAGLLRGMGIEVITKTEASYAESPTSGGEGTVRIDVATADADAALKVLQDREAQA
ncbi:MAG: putative signal transducing protein [Euzebya sp.]